jgi:hypothetical protein
MHKLSFKKLLFMASVILFSSIVPLYSMITKEYIKEYEGNYQPWYINKFIPYRLLTSTIDILQYLRANIVYALLYYSQLNNQEKVDLLQNHLNNAKQNIYNKETDTITNILKQHNIDSDIFYKKLTDLQRHLPSLYDKSQAYHDWNGLDAFTLTTTKDFLKKYNLDPSNHAIMRSNSPCSHSTQTTFTLYNSVIHVTSSINFCDEHNKLPENERIGVIAHEVTHVHRLHFLKQHLFLKALKENNPAYDFVANHNNDLHPIRTIFEEQADLLPSIDCNAVCKAQKNDNKHYPYPGHLYLQHYQNICAIDITQKLAKRFETMHNKQRRISIPNRFATRSIETLLRIKL